MCEHDYRICRIDDDLLQFNIHGFFKWGIKIKKVIVIDRAIAMDSGPAREVLNAYTCYQLYLIKDVAKNLGLKYGMFLRGKHKTIRIGRHRYTDAQTILNVLEGINKYEKKGLKLDVYDQYLLEFRYQVKQNEMPIEELISVFRKKDSFEQWFAGRIKDLMSKTEQLTTLDKIHEKASHESMDFRTDNPKFSYWYDETGVPKDADRKECSKYLKFLSQQKEILAKLRAVGVECECYREAVLAMIKMLTDAAKTHYARLAIHRFKELNGNEQEVKDFFLKSLYDENLNNCIEQIKYASEPYYTYQRNKP